MTFHDFCLQVVTTKLPEDQRWGQFAFNSLYEIRPEIADKIRGTIYDPFHDNERLGPFWYRVEELWDDSDLLR